MKYKLIKEYPGSPKLGTVLVKKENGWYEREHSPGCAHLPQYIENSPEFWQEVKNPHYEILAFKHVNSGDLSTKRKNGLFLNDPDPNKDGQYREYRDFSIWTIYRVKRLSDGEVFTVGDRYEVTNPIKETRTIGIMYESSDKLMIRPREFGISELCEIQKPKKPILTTEDGVDLYKGDVALRVLTKSSWPIEGITIYKEWWDRQPILTDWKYFSTKEAAEKYVYLHKPMFTRQDILSFVKINTWTEMQYGEKVVDISYNHWLKFIHNENK